MEIFSRETKIFARMLDIESKLDTVNQYLEVFLGKLYR